MLFSIIGDGVSAFRQATLSFPVTLAEERLDENGNRDPDDLADVTTVGYANILEDAFNAELAQRGIAQAQ